MKKSILGASFMSTILAVIISVSVSVSATESMTVSEPLVDKIKNYEGFSSYAIWDSNQYSIGYGTRYDGVSYPNGITEAEATELLLVHISSFETAVNNFAATNSIVLEQHQFDAMVSMTYNLGTSWLKTETKVWSYLISGDYTEEQMASAMVAWCKSGGSILEGLITRRTDEAMMFLFADYDGSSGKSLIQVNYNAGDGSKSNDLTLHVAGQPYGVMATAEQDGYYFAGWYTADGTLITSETVAQTNQTLYARWSTVPVETVVQQETVVSPEIVATGVFSDVADDAWYAPYVNLLAESSVLSGYEDGTFRPESNVTTGEVLKIMMGAMGYESQEPTGDHWASGYFDTAAEDGLLVGMTIDTVDTALSRENVAILATNLLDVPEVYEMNIFADTNSNAANALYAMGIIGGSVEADDKRWFYPEQGITRAELSKIVALMMEV